MTGRALVTLPGAILRDILAHARGAAPNECCGLLIGTAVVTTGSSFETTDTNIQIASSSPARNLSQSPTRYLIDPVDHFAAIRTARARGRTVVGGYHSHPSGPPLPSETDHRDASDAEFLYLIVSPNTGAAKAWRLSAGRLRAVTMRVLGDTSDTGASEAYSP